MTVCVLRCFRMLVVGYRRFVTTCRFRHQVRVSKKIVLHRLTDEAVMLLCLFEELFILSTLILVFNLSAIHNLRMSAKRNVV